MTGWCVTAKAPPDISAISALTAVKHGNCSSLTPLLNPVRTRVVRNGKSTAGHQRYLCSHCRKTWQLQFTYTASQPGTHQKIIDMAMN
ncbi:IS1 family transposase, partial [Escherichia coli]|uniref:IS1 family transposase n=1 Tax=Escherichia coli TaxID=562 RepID=UPI00286EDA29